MPKLKTNKSAAKRVTLSKKGKVRVHRPGRRHLLTGKRSKHKRGLRRPATVAASDERQFRALLPYGRR